MPAESAREICKSQAALDRPISAIYRASNFSARSRNYQVMHYISPGELHIRSDSGDEQLSGDEYLGKPPPRPSGAALK